MDSARAIQRAARAARGTQFLTDFSARAPYSAWHPRFLAAVRARTAWPEPHAYDSLADTSFALLSQIVGQRRSDFDIEAATATNAR